MERSQSFCPPFPDPLFKWYIYWTPYLFISPGEPHPSNGISFTSICISYNPSLNRSPTHFATISVTSSGKPYSTSSVDSINITVKLTVILTTPPRNAAAPISANVPASIEGIHPADLHNTK